MDSQQGSWASTALWWGLAYFLYREGYKKAGLALIVVPPILLIAGSAYAVKKERERLESFNPGAMV